MKILTGFLTSWICKGFLIISFLGSPTIMKGQDTAQTVVKKDRKIKKCCEEGRNHSPKKATLLATFLPGAGQIYNRRYWKLPIVYGGFGALAYSIVYNNTNYNLSRSTFNNWQDGQVVVIDGYIVNSQERARVLKDYYRRSRDLSYFLSAALYALQIVDANVDAHLMCFEVNEDLILSFRPHLEPTNRSTSFGLSLTLGTK